MRVGSSIMAIFAYFTRYVFRTFTFNAIIIILYYVDPYSVSSWTPKQMTLNDLEWPFCKICRATHILSATEMQPMDPSFQQGKIYMDIPGGSLDRGHQITVGSSKMEIFASFACNATIIILYYVAPQWLFSDTETMTLSDLEWSFCVKMCLELGI